MDHADWRESPGYLGSLDLPSEPVRASMLDVFGWVAFASGPAVRVTVYVDGRPTAARNALPRPDLNPVLGVLGAASAGFAAAVEPALESDDTRPVRIAVVAEGRRGERWHAPERTVSFGRPAADPAWRAELDRLEHPRPAELRVDAAPLELCVFTHSLAIGGGQLWLQDLVLSLARSGAARIRVVSPSDGALRAELEAAGVSIHLTAGLGVDRRLYAGRVIELATMLRAWQTDAVLVNTLGLLVAADAAAVAGLPFVWAIHESFPLRTYAAAGWGVPALDPGLEDRWRTVLCAGHLMFEADATSELFGQEVPAARRTTVRYNVDRAAIDSYRSTSDRAALRRQHGIARSRLVLLCMGVFEARKAEIPLLHAFAPIAARFPEALLVLVGAHPSPYTDAVRSVVEELHMQDSVQLIPIDEDAYRWYAMADVLVSASDIESLPRSMLEAMTFGLPVAAADVFGVGELIDDGQTGWLFAARDVDALTTALRRVLDTPAQERAVMGARAVARAADFGSAHYALDMLALVTGHPAEGTGR